MSLPSARSAHVLQKINLILLSLLFVSCAQNTVLRDPQSIGRESHVWSSSQSYSYIESEIKNKERERSLPLKFQRPPKELLKCLRVLHVAYKNKSGLIQRGNLIVNQDIASSLGDVFDELLNVNGFYIERVEGLSRYHWSDDRSMANNNSSAWNYRSRAQSARLSWHALGLAVDINPRSNPFVTRSGSVYPKNSQGYRPKKSSADSASTHDSMSVTQEVVGIFKKHGFKWGGDWRSSKDYQHFEKLPRGLSPSDSVEFGSYCNFVY